jgi:glycine/D-amino acid oxidase-like deaminating enzyme
MTINSKKVAVIGGGVFGCEIASQLSQLEFTVSLFESSPNLLTGATANSQNRLHLGLHYPRDLETAIQSRIGFTKFKEKYPYCVRNNFPNYYAVASRGSKVSNAEFEKFTQNSGILVQKVSTKELFSLGLDPQDVEGLYLCEEGVIDIDKLRSELWKRISESSVEMKLNTQISQIQRTSEGWNLISGTHDEGNFEFVVDATYGSGGILIDGEFPGLTYEYHHTLIVEVEADIKSFGLTIVDGDFLTILPKGFTDRFYIYAPSLSVRDRYTGETPPENWKSNFDDEFQLLSQRILERTKEWLPGFEIKRLCSLNKTVRSIQPNMQATDRRVSEITERTTNIWEIHSGKIDHCVEVGNKLSNILTNLGSISSE